MVPGCHIFQQIDTKFPTELELSNAEFVLGGKWDRKYKLDFRDVRIPLSVIVHSIDPRSMEHSYAC